jgi:hypothetical protein
MLSENLHRSMKPDSLGDAQFRRFGRATDAFSVQLESASVDATYFSLRNAFDALVLTPNARSKTLKKD